MIVFFVQLSNAQNTDLQRANRLFDKTFYTEAIPLYESIIQENHSILVIKNLADAYYYTNDYSKAQNYYRILLKNWNKDFEEEYYFRFSQTLKATGDYEESNTVIRDYLVSSNNPKALVDFERENKILENISAIGERFEIRSLPINTINSEFGAVKQGSNLVYSGVKEKVGVFDKMYKWNGETYLNLVSIPIKNINSKDSIPSSFSTEINTSMHESNAIFTKDGKTVYFTRNNYKKGKRGKNSDRISNLQILKGELIDGKWGNIVSLPFNSDDYSIEHPALSNDEKTLYFASDMPGTLGSFDIFCVDIIGTGFGVPKNLGNKINTSKKEQFPFVSKDNKLYFSSNGHTGYGSLDVFVSEIEKNDFSKPLNIGLPVNSGFDDFCFVIDSDSKEGYFSSDRIGGKGRDDIYELKEVKPLVIKDCIQFIKGVIFDIDTKLPLNNVLVTLQNSDTVTIQKTSTTEDGKFAFTVACEAGYLASATKEGYTGESVSLKLKKERNKSNDASMSLKSLLTIRSEEQFALEQKKKMELILAEKQKKEKLIIAEKEIKAAQILKKQKEDAIILAEKNVIKVKDQLFIKTDYIYFDYDLWYIRKKAKTTLDHVIELMKKYPNMIVEIGSYTDNRGDSDYNLELSAKRAESIKSYFINQEIQEKRIIAKGYGETFQIIKCEPSESCTEEQHELNRRSEFKIQNL